MDKESKYSNIIMYFLSLLLILYYLNTLFNIARPNVCKEYKMYYITKELKDWPGYNGLNYKLGTQLMFKNTSGNVAKCKGEGWNETEESGTWTKEKAMLYLNVLDGAEESINLNIGILDFVPEAEVSIKINEQLIGKLRPQKEIKEYQFSVPKDIVKDKFLTIQIYVENSIRPSDLNESSDGRLLGIYVTNISLKKMDGDNVIE